MLEHLNREGRLFLGPHVVFVALPNKLPLLIREVVVVELRAFGAAPTLVSATEHELEMLGLQHNTCSYTATHYLEAFMTVAFSTPPSVIQ